jgi:hypothetical protein
VIIAGGRRSGPSRARARAAGGGSRDASSRDQQVRGVGAKSGAGTIRGPAHQLVERDPTWARGARAWAAGTSPGRGAARLRSVAETGRPAGTGPSRPIH